MTDIAKELDDVLKRRQTNGYHVRRIAGQARDEIERLRGLVRDMRQFVPEWPTVLHQRIAGALGAADQPRCDLCNDSGWIESTDERGGQVMEPCEHSAADQPASCRHWWTFAPDPAEVECKVCGAKRAADQPSAESVDAALAKHAADFAASQTYLRPEESRVMYKHMRELILRDGPADQPPAFALQSAAGQPCDQPAAVACPQCGMTDAKMCRRLDCERHWGGQYPIDADKPADQPAAESGCRWTQSEEGAEWQSGCGLVWWFEDDGPTENGAKFCCGCGKPLVAVPFVALPVCGECGEELEDGECPEGCAADKPGEVQS